VEESQGCRSLGKPRERDEDDIKIYYMLNEYDVRDWTELMWLKIGTIGVFL
jgi:hypothetical protein